MKKISSAWLNPTATSILDDPIAQEHHVDATLTSDPLGRGMSNLSTPTETEQSNLMLLTMDQCDRLFDEVALFSRDILLGEKPDPMTNDSLYIKFKNKLASMHILDALDYVNNGGNFIQDDVQALLI